MPALLYFFSLLVALTAPAQAEVFKWTDASGKTHYSDTPPPANPRKDLSDKLEAPVCGGECQENVRQQSKYRQQYLKGKQVEEQGKQAEIRKFDRKWQQEQNAKEAAQKREYDLAVKRSKSERSRVPSKQIRRP